MGIMAEFKDKEFGYSQSDFDRVKSIIFKHAGISLSDHKKHLVYSRLAPRIRKNGLTAFKEYFELIERDNVEYNAFINALTTNKTSFFREHHHFDFIANEILPEAIKRKRSFKVWSAGCSSGQEPYNLAMLLHPYFRDYDVSVLATDLDTNVLDKAKKGIYDLSETSDVPRDILKKYFLRGKNENSGMVKISSELQKLITFKQLNLMHDWPMRKKFDVIFCRNVIIYFDKPTQKQLFKKFAQHLESRGYLVLGHSESMGTELTDFEFLGKTIYRKTA